MLVDVHLRANELVNNESGRLRRFQMSSVKEICSQNEDMRVERRKVFACGFTNG